MGSFEHAEKGQVKQRLHGTNHGQNRPRMAWLASSHAMRGVALWAMLIGLIAAALLAISAVWWQLSRPLPLATPSIELSIEPGTSPRAIARDWVDAGVQVPAWALYQWFRWSGQSSQIRAGNYELNAGASARDLLRMMVRGDERLGTVRLIEGWTFRQVRQALAQSPDLKHTTAQMSNTEIMAALGEPQLPPEGQFFPDTYTFGKGSSDLAVLKRAHHVMQRVLDQAWDRRAADSPLTSSTEALILASIIEKETGREADRAMVAGVFVNRLRIGMPLQTDPTVIYGLGERFDGNLRRIDLQTDTPYNTYTRTGLPPTPIAMPGRASLMAAVMPAPTRALYFVARGDGSSEFSESLAAHNRAVDRFQRNPPKKSR